MKFGSYFFFALVCCVLRSCAPAAKPYDNRNYIVDPGISSQVSKKLKSSDGKNASSLFFKAWQNDSIIAENLTHGKILSDCITMSDLEGDSLQITSFAGMFAGFGYRIVLFRDTAVVRFMQKSDTEIYALNKDDSLSFGVFVPCRSYKLTLSKKPEFKREQIIEGMIDLRSEDFYEVANGKINRYSMQIVGYFRVVVSE